MNLPQRLRALADRTGLDGFAEELRALANEQDQARELMRAQILHEVVERLTQGYGANSAPVSTIKSHFGLDDLWCIHIPGPGGVHAAPSRDAAHHMATRHNQAMAAHYEKHPPDQVHGPSVESTMASVIVWPHSPVSHAQAVAAFDWAAWGLEMGKGAPA